MSAPRIVLDTNVVLSGFASPSGAPGRIRQALGEGAFDLCLSEPLFAEYCDVLRRPKLIALAERAGMAQAMEEFLRGIGEVALWPEGEMVIEAVLAADPDDDVVLATAVACEADAIVSGDKHVLALQPEYRGIAVMTPGEFVENLKLP